MTALTWAAGVLAIIASAGGLGLALARTPHRRRPRPVEVVPATLLGALALAAIAAIVLADGGPAIVRVPVLLLGLLLAPGAALVGFRPFTDLIDNAVVAVAFSLTILVLGAALMLAAGQWHPQGLVAVLSVLAAPTLAWHAGRSTQVNTVPAPRLTQRSARA